MDVFKHFSHNHGLNFHQMPQGSKGQCSGCQSPVSGNIYACWQCNHFLHEQCFHATRSLKHSSHPPHPLTLVPNPTYQSGSFQCQSCSHIGNGMSYACTECQFDIHVHCALSLKQNSQVSSPPVQNDAQNYNSHMQNPTNPHLNTQNFSPHHYNPHPLKPQHPHTNTQNSTFPQQNPPVSNYGIPVSVPYTNSPVNHIETIRNPTTIYATNPPPLPSPFYPATNQATLGGGFANQNIPFRPTYHQINTQAPNYNPPTSMSYANPSAQTSATIRPSMPPPVYPSTINQSPQNDGLADTNNTIPPHYHNENTHMSNYSPTTSAPFPNPPIQPTTTIPNLSTNPTNNTNISPPPTHDPIYPTTTQNLETNNCQSRSPSITKHFSHPHALQIAELDTRTKKICSACECYISSTAYCCTEPYCTFNLHRSCFDSPVEPLHTSHHPHPLKLVTSPPYPNGFTCDACCQGGKAFAYTCAICSYDLHVDCASWPEKMTMPYHEHELTLYYSSASIQKNHDGTFFCDTCNNPGHESAWAYYCRECNFGTHLECVACELKPERASTSGTDQLENVYLQGLIAKQTQEHILELWDKPKKKKTREYTW